MDVSSLICESKDRFRISALLYGSGEIFSNEMKKIYGRSWVYLAHESQLPDSGDYLTTTLGIQPVIVARLDSGAISVLLNRCAHRGAVVCREENGHAQTFRCPYHAWVYGNDGHLVGPAQRSGYPDDFAEWGLGLEKVPRVESYRGLIFACLDSDVEPLKERLRYAKKYVDAWANRSPKAETSVSRAAQKYIFPGNWKFQMENGVDGYHGNYVHESFAKLLDRSGELSMGSLTRSRNQVGSLNFARGFANGDGLLERSAGMLGTFDSSRFPRYREQLSESFGQETADDILVQRNIFIFPNLYLFESHVRVIRPVDFASTVVEVFPTVLSGVDQELNQARLREHERFFGPASFGATDDIEMFVSAQSGLSGDDAAWLDMSRGLHREKIVSEGERVGHSTDEVPQRSAYRQWLKCMTGSHSDSGLNGVEAVS